MHYFVLNENALGYVDRTGKFDVLASNLFKNGPNPMNGPIYLNTETDHIRPATIKDFDLYRVCADGHMR